MTATRWLSLALVLALPTAAAQDIQPVYPVTLIALSVPLADQLAQAHAAHGPERLWCVTAWETRDTVDRHAHPYTLVHVTTIREDTTVTTEAHGVKLDRNAVVCRDSAGRALPTLHSHPGGTCQASPDDHEAMLVRMAPFDGILCGPRAHAWYFAPQMLDALQWRQHLALTAKE